ncbi:MAG: Lon protease family protein [Hyphomicrobium sp.]
MSFAGTEKNPKAKADFHSPLPITALYKSTDLKDLPFTTTADLKAVDGEAPQERALEAILFGIQVERQGYNLFVIGPRETHMRDVVSRILKQAGRDRKPPSDWVYVNNFQEPNKPTAIELPMGRAPQFQIAMHELVEDLKATLPSVFEGEDYSTRRAAIEDKFNKIQADAFTTLRDKATQKGVAILRTPFGFTLAPEKNGVVVPQSEFAKWSSVEQEQTRIHIDLLEKELDQVVRQVPRIEKERREAIRNLNRETAEAAVGHLIDEVKSQFSDLPQIINRLETVRNDLLENVGIFIQKRDEGFEIPQPPLAHTAFERYEVNVFITHEKDNYSVQIIEEFHPTLGNLMGRVEHVAHQGTLITNFRLIRAGALHRANSGFLILDLRQILSEPFSWGALKRSLQRGSIVIEDVGQLLGFATSSPLQPDPIPLNTKIIIFADRLLYFLLAELDPEVGQYFKVLADFEDDIERNSKTETAYARIIASIATHEGLLPVSREAVAKIIDQCARISGDAERLSLLTELIRDLLIEAEHSARIKNLQAIEAIDIQKAIDQKDRRNGRIRDRVQDTILREYALISTTGSAVGQVNALSVHELASFRFGRPSRITCRVRPGSGKVIDIEREVKLGGPTHSKGVLILSGYLAGQYALDTPMSLFASLVFEQSYGGVEGDSASAAELLALLSALSEVPLRQDLAITGSVNQNGEIQAVGGVNEKIEGFFDICKARGLSSTQGVIIPKANVRNLMLREDVCEACKSGQFGVYAISTVDEGLALLSGLSSGARQLDGEFPVGSVNFLIEERLRNFADVRRTFSENANTASALHNNQ